MKFISVLLFSFSASVMAGNFCEYKKIKDKYPDQFERYCRAEVEISVKYKTKGGKRIKVEEPATIYVPNEFALSVNKNFDKDFKCKGWFGRCKNLSSMIETIDKQALSSTVSSDSLNFGSASDYSGVVQVAKDLSAKQSEIGTQQEALASQIKMGGDRNIEYHNYLKSQGIDIATAPPVEQLGDVYNCDKNCQDITAGLKKHTQSKTDVFKKQKEVIDNELGNQRVKVESLREKLNKFERSNSFKNYARKQLTAAGVDIEDNENPYAQCDSVDKESGQKLLDVCNKLLASAESLGLVFESLDQTSKDIDEKKKISDFLGMKLDLDSIKALDNVELQKAAMAELNSDIEKKIKGTVIDQMMNQVRADMCSIAQTPELSCSDFSEVKNNFVNNVTPIIKKMREDNQHIVDSIVNGSKGTQE